MSEEDNLIGSMWLHKKTNNVYAIIGRCILESTNMPGILYRKPADREAWARDEEEFMDGRFERLY